MKPSKKSFISIYICFAICLISIYSNFSTSAKELNENEVQIINASDVDSTILELNKNHETGIKYILNMNSDLNLDTIEANDFTISGSGKLTVKCIHVNKLTLKSGSNVNVINGHIRIGDSYYTCEDEYSLIIEKNANLRIYQDSSYIGENMYETGADRFSGLCIYCYGHIKSAGNVDLYSNHCSGIICVGSLTIESGILNIKCDGAGYTDQYYNYIEGGASGIVSTSLNNFNVLDGTVSIVTPNRAIDVGNINIFNGNVYLKSNDEYGRVLYTSYNITINGGKVEAESSVPSKNIIRARSISIADTLSITVPKYGKLYTPDNMYWNSEAYISDYDDNEVNRIVIEASSGSSNNSPYSNEWVNGKWYNSDGSQTYEYNLTWKSNANGWWVEDNNGWYPTNLWQKIDGTWYYFNSNGYMASNEWIDGWWINKDGSCTYNGVGSWKSNSNGWWFSDTTGWYASNMWLKIDNKWYYFKSNGYIATNQKIDGYWVDSNGVCN